MNNETEKQNEASPARRGRPNIRPITEAQSKVLLFISNYIDERRYPPSYRDISAELEFASTNAVTNHMMALEAKGYVKSERGKARALWLTDKGLTFIRSCKKAKTN